MLKIVKTTVLITASLLLTACFHMYRPTIQQGNVVTASMLSQVKTGMSQEQVRYLLGTPVLVNTFDPNRWDYIYTYKPGGKPTVQQDITLHFNKGILQNVESTPLVSLPSSEK